MKLSKGCKGKGSLMIQQFRKEQSSDNALRLVVMKLLALCVCESTTAIVTECAHSKACCLSVCCLRRLCYIQAPVSTKCSHAEITEHVTEQPTVATCHTQGGSVHARGLVPTALTLTFLTGGVAPNPRLCANDSTSKQLAFMVHSFIQHVGPDR